MNKWFERKRDFMLGITKMYPEILESKCITRKQIKEFVSENDLMYPAWITSGYEKQARGVFLIHDLEDYLEEVTPIAEVDRIDYENFMKEL